MAEARHEPLGLHIESLRDDLAPYFVEEIRQYLEHTYGTAAVHEQGLRVYTTLNVAMQKAADQAVRDGLHAYDRRHGWRGNLPNIRRDHLGTIETYDNDDWHGTHREGRLRHRAGHGSAADVRIDQDRRVSRHAHARGFRVDGGKIRPEAAESGRSSHRAHRRIVGDNGGGPARATANSPGGPARDRQCERRNQGDGRRLRFRAIEIRSRHAGDAADGQLVQGVRLRRGACAGDVAVRYGGR